jgi:hypothetical protein
MRKISIIGATIFAGVASLSFSKQQIEPEPQFEGVFSYWDAASKSYVGLPRETPETKTKMSALGLGGAKVYFQWPTPACAKRFSSAKPPKLAVRVQSTQKDPHDIVQFFKVETSKNGRKLKIVSVGAFGGAKSTMSENSMGFSASVMGKSSLLIAPDTRLTPGEYILSTNDSQNSYCFGIDQGEEAAIAPVVVQNASRLRPALPPVPARAPASSVPQYSNDPKVSFRTPCPGLYIVKVYETRYEGMIPAYAMDFVNVSDNRYSVSYDLTYTQRGQGIHLGRSVESLTEERHLTSRGGNNRAMYTTLLAKKQTSDAYFISSIDKVSVFKCELT